MIGLCTDSNSQIPAELAARYGVAVVPLTVTVDDRDYLEGVDLDADEFYAMFDDGRKPTVSTSQPSPGQFAVAYDELIARGCTIRLVDTGTASFGVSCCVWAAGDAIAGGASLDEAALCAERLSPSIGNVFVVGALDLVQAGGRAGAGLSGDGIPVLTLRDGQVQAIARVDTVDAAVEAMAAHAIAWGHSLRVAVGIADRGGEPLAAALEHAVRTSGDVREVVQYRVGPSVGAHTGPGTAGCFMFPA
jgi:fatty acid-binding protein DegV